MDRPRQLSTVVLVALLTLGACGPSSAHRCADLFVQALATPERTIAGAFGCLSPRFRDSWQQRHVSGDVDFRGYAAMPPVWRRVRLIGQQSDGGFLYELHIGSRTAYLIVWQDPMGLVIDDNVAYCPVGDCGRGGVPPCAAASYHIACQ